MPDEKLKLESEINDFINDFKLFFKDIEIEYVNLSGETKNILITDLIKISNVNDIDFDDISSNIINKFFILSKIYINEEKTEIWQDPLGTLKYNEQIPEIYIENQTLPLILLFQFEKDTKNLMLSLYSLYVKNEISFKMYKNNDFLYIDVFSKTRDYKEFYFLNSFFKNFNNNIFKKYFDLILQDINILNPINIKTEKNKDFILKYFNENNKNYYIDESFNKREIRNDVIGVGTFEKNLIEERLYRLTNKRTYLFDINNVDKLSFNEIIRIFLFGLLYYKNKYIALINNESENQFIDLSNVETDMLVGNVNNEISSQMINKSYKYDLIDNEELNEFLAPIPSKILYDNEKHIIMQGLFEDIKNYINNIQKYIVGENIDTKGVSVYFNSTSVIGLVGDINILNYMTFNNLEKDFNVIKEILLNENYPRFSRINLLNEIYKMILQQREKVIEIADVDGFFNKQTLIDQLPALRNKFYELAKAVASQEQPLSFGNPSFDSNPNEKPFRNDNP